MDIQASKMLLLILVENAARILRANYGVDWAEASFIAVIDLLRQEHLLKVEFLQRCEATLSQYRPLGLEEGCVPLELIEFAAFELRWPELADLADERLNKVFGNDRKRAAGDAAVRIEAALRDDWPDVDFYKRYAD